MSIVETIVESFGQVNESPESAVKKLGHAAEDRPHVVLCDEKSCKYNSKDQIARCRRTSGIELVKLECTSYER